MDPTLVLVGDSVTDCGRSRSDDHDLGHGWAALVGDTLAGDPATRRRVLNRGVSGHRAVDLAARWDLDVLAARPDTVAIMIGINDTWRRYDDDDPTSTAHFAATYASLVERTAAAGVPRIILLEPVLTPVSAAQWGWREDLDPKISVIRRIALEHRCELVPTDAVLNAAAPTLLVGALAADGVHPTEHGHRLIADAFLAAYLRR